MERGIREIAPDVFRVRVSTGDRDPLTGSPEQFERTVRGGIREARRVHAELKAKASAGRSGVPSMTVGELLDAWLAAFAKRLGKPERAGLELSSYNNSGRWREHSDGWTLLRQARGRPQGTPYVSFTCWRRQNQSVEISDTLGFLLGTWELERLIDDHRERSRGSFAGSADLVPMAKSDGARLSDRARYDERGQMRFLGHLGPAFRSLEYAQLDESRVMLYFTDGRPFVDLDLRSGAWRSEHPCAEDHYEITTVVRSKNVVQEYWRVRGPETDYDAVTTLRRVG